MVSPRLQRMSESTRTEEEAVAETKKCLRCNGCGRIANSDDGEPWTMWETLPVKSAAAVIMGLVRPIPCPACNGTGKAEKAE